MVHTATKGTTAKHGGLYARFAVDLVKYEAGMVAENLALQATALGLQATPVGAFEAGKIKVCERVRVLYIYFVLYTHTHLLLNPSEEKNRTQTLKKAPPCRG